MTGVQGWIEENRPSGDLDYQRIADAAEAIEKEIETIGPKAVLDRRFNYDTAMKYGMRRIEETSHEIRLENPDWKTWSGRLTQAWAEGFAFGALAYTQEHRGRSAEPFLDRIALTNINHTLATADEGNLKQIYSGLVSRGALKFVSVVRSVVAYQAVGKMKPVASHQAVKTLMAGHWLDGFVVGLVFEELGGHREVAE